jgi:hypothetical protein
MNSPIRRAHLFALAGKFWIPTFELLEQCDSSSAEDMWEYLYGHKQIERWAAITCSTEGSQPLYYVKTLADREAAVEHSVEYVTDALFAEFPIALCDLDAAEEPWGKLYPLMKLVPVYKDDPDD